MNTIELQHKLQQIFPDFKKSQAFIEELVNLGRVVEFKSGTTIINSGEYIKVITFLIDGLIKIYREDPDGNEILLYYINSGESCVISITSSLRNEKSTIKALVVEQARVFAVPNDKFEYLLGRYNLLHAFTYDLFSNKYNQLIDSIDSLAFMNMQSRLFNYLQKEAQNSGRHEIQGLTHKSIATDLSTSREVISRLLSALQKEGRVRLENKKIILLNPL